ncbi:MAG: benzoyl-CoA reductase, bzd-type, subunit Q [Myxococcales bacterium]|nr:MAG: benzoyl-CoA reductase, bzd-type, subunit Q [Myxococcales bacterium]
MAAEREFWRWTESAWRDPAIDPKAARTLVMGVDIGSVSSQAAVLADGRLFAASSTRTGSSSPDAAKKAAAMALESTGLAADAMQFVVGTGYGRVNVPFADKTVTEIACHARGAHVMSDGAARTILDMGGQDCKVIRCDASGKVVNFLMNDKCAAGTGRGMEVLAQLLAVPIEEIGPMSLDVSQEPEPVSSTCVVFAKTEAMGLMRRGMDKKTVLAAYCLAMAKRVAALIGRVGIEPAFVVTGGIAKNAGVVRRVERLLGVTAAPLNRDSQLAGALGAAHFALDALAKQRSSDGQ